MGSFTAHPFFRRFLPATRRAVKLGCLVGAAAGAALLLAADGYGRLTTPAPTSPANGAVVEAVPAFAWTAVLGAAAYEFQIVADAGMNSQHLGRGKDQFVTRNVRATLVETVQNGT